MKLLVLDGNSIVNRAFYGVKLLATYSGTPTNAITGFFNILLKLQNDHNPDEVAIAFDLKAPTFRHKMYSDYKAHRKGMPEELAAQMPILKELLQHLGYTCVSCEGYEADDILGTLAACCKQRGDTCLLSTGDRDSLQLIGDGTYVVLAGGSAAKGSATLTGEAEVFEKYGVTPGQLIDVKGLMGDASDNIPGVAGIGEKTALMLIQNFKTIDGVYENIDDAKIKKGAREKLIAGKESAYKSRELATIVCNAPIVTEVGAYTIKTTADGMQKASDIFSSLEMYSMIKKLKLDDVGEDFFSLGADVEPLSTVEPLPLTTLKPSAIAYIFFANDDDGNEIAAVVQDAAAYKASPNSDEFIALLCDKNIEKQCFDAKKCYKIAIENNTCAQNITFDAKLAAYLLNPQATSYTLGHLAQIYAIQPKFSCKYSDAAVAEELFAAIAKDCDKAEMSDVLYKIELPLCEVLADMECAGIQIDAHGIKNFGEELQKSLEQELAIIYDIVGYEFNVNSPKQLAKALYEDMGLPTGKKTKSGYSTNAETLERLQKYSPVIGHILSYRTYQKLNSTYVEGLLRLISSDGRIHTTFNQTETRTGRISSEEPNLQNIPVRTELGSRLRKYFMASSGKTLLDADYSQIELRILANISNDTTMLDAFERGADIHRSTAAKSYGVEESAVTPHMRSCAKAINFGIVYGIGAFSLAKDLNITVKQADSFIKSYFTNFPGIKSYLDKTVEKAKEDGFVRTLYGRKRNLPELKNSNFNVRSLGERMAMNTPIQGTAADIIKLAMVRVYSRFKSENLCAKLILQVHDELIVECPKDEVDIAKAILSDEMRGAASLLVPLVADVNTADTWYDAKG